MHCQTFSTISNNVFLFCVSWMNYKFLDTLASISTILHYAVKNLQQTVPQFKYNCYLAIFLSAADRIINDIMIRMQLNYGCIKIFCKNGLIAGQFAANVLLTVYLTNINWDRNPNIFTGGIAWSHSQVER